MSKKPLVPDAKEKLDKMKMEVAGEFGVQSNLHANDAYSGNLTSKETGLKAEFKNVGNVGGEMVKRMLMQAEKELAAREKNNLN